MDYMIQAYNASDFFSTMFSAFSTGWSTVMNFISSNIWLVIIVAVPVILGLLGAVLSFIKSR